MPRTIERHPTSGPLWWLCAHMLTAADPYGTARRLADEIDGDGLQMVLADAVASVLAAANAAPGRNP